MNIPFIEPGLDVSFSEADKNIISDVVTFNQEFLRHGEGSRAVSKIVKDDFKTVINNYSNAFTQTLNEIYERENKRFYLTDVIDFDNHFIATIFKYKNQNTKEVIFHDSTEQLNLSELSNFDLSKHLSINRIIKLYPVKDVIVFIKPNQYRYWLTSIAYRDADKYLSDLTKLGY